jgi:hypothetical protein
MLGEQFTVLGDHSISAQGPLHSALGAFISTRGAVHSARGAFY